jgi:cyclopropane fatty-acyl-phospholipid synthase-like methyltransferase
VEDHVPLYASAYAGFSAREQIRLETYGEDLGQSGWLTVDELDLFAEWLDLRGDSRLLDIGCGSGGTDLRLAETTGASVIGVDMSAEGIATAKRLASERQLDDRTNFRQLDASRQLPFADGSFDAVLSVDAMCHLPGRADVLTELHRVMTPGGRIVFTDPTIVTGLVTGDELTARSSIGIYVFSVGSVNEHLLAEAGFELLCCDDRTENMATIAGRWHAARERFRDAVVADEGESTFARVQDFLATCQGLASERRLSRFAYLATR